jgi:hypothetical protein
VGQTLHKWRICNPNEEIILLKFNHGQIYNGKLAHRYCHASMDACPLCHNRDSCAQIVGKCLDHKALRIIRHNAACQLVHAAIHKTSKGGGSIHSAPDLVPVIANTGSQSQTSIETLESLSSTQEKKNSNLILVATPPNLLAPLATTVDIRRKRHTHV